MIKNIRTRIELSYVMVFFFKLVETRKISFCAFISTQLLIFFAILCALQWKFLSQTQFIFHVYLLLLRTLLILIDADVIFFSLRHFYYEWNFIKCSLKYLNKWAQRKKYLIIFVNFLQFTFHLLRKFLFILSYFNNPSQIGTIFYLSLICLTS